MKTNHRAGANAGFALVFALARHWPGTALICLSAASCHSPHGEDAKKTSEAASDSVCGRWQSSHGESYEFDAGGTYTHWQQLPPVSKSAQAQDPDNAQRIGISKGRFLVASNWLILTDEDGRRSTKKFSIRKNLPENHEGKFFQNGYSLTIITADGRGQTYELLYW